METFGRGGVAVVCFPGGGPVGGGGGGVGEYI